MESCYGLCNFRLTPSFVLCVNLLITLWSTVSPQQVTMGFQAMGQTNEFPDSYAGVNIQHPNQNMIGYAYVLPVAGYWYCKIYNADSGAEIGSLSSTTYGETESFGLTGTSYITILEKTQGVFTYQLQSVTSSTAAFSYQSSMSSNALTNKYFSSPLSEPSTTYIYANYFSSQGSFLSTPFVTLYKIDVMNIAGMLTKNLDPPTSMPNGKFCFQMAHYINDIVINMNSKTVQFVSRLDLTLLYELTGTTLGYNVVLEPTELAVTYMSTYTGNSVEKRRPVTLAGAQTLLASVPGGTTIVKNLIRIATFRLLLLNSVNTNIIKFIDIDDFTGLLASQPTFSGNMATMSLMSPKVENLYVYISFINTNTKRFEYYYLRMDYCLFYYQIPCLQCDSGRFLDSATIDNTCLKPLEFPPRYGIDGDYMGVCLGDLTKGCLACTSVSTCTSCDNASGFFLRTPTGLCYKQQDFPSGLGLNTANNLIEVCTAANCVMCRADKSVCNGCNTNYYLKEGSSTTCYTNNLVGFGLKLVSSNYVLAACQPLNCDVCFSDYSVCIACKPGFYLKQGSGAQCYTNTLDYFGLRTIGPDTVLSACSDSNCKLCRTNYATCTQCTTGMFLYASVCTTPQPGFGGDGSGVNFVPCNALQCSDCGADYTICNQCYSPFYLLENQHTSCNINDQDYRGLKNVSGQLVLSACTVVHCQWCLAAYDFCDICQNSYYPSKEGDNTCKSNNTPGRGLEVVGGIDKLTDCVDSNCKYCYASAAVCTECNVGYYQVLGREMESNSCRSSLQGYGLPPGAAPMKKLTPCSDARCSDCAVDNTVCVLCQTGDYPLLSPAGACKPNNVPGFGVYTDSNGAKFLSACQLPNCQLCYHSVTSCMNCTDPFILNPLTRLCVVNNVEGMGKFTDPENYAYLEKCFESSCSNCAAAYEICKACISPEMEVSDNRCVWINSNPIKLRLPIYFRKKTNSFVLHFDGALYSNISEVLEGYSYSLRKFDSSEIASRRYSIEVVRTGETDFTGTIKTQESIEESNLIMQSKNPVVAYIRNSTSQFDPNEPIIVNEVGISNYSRSTDKAIQTVVSATLTAAGVAGAITLASTGNTRQAAFMIKMIDSVEFTLYLGGIRVYRAIYFLYILQHNIFQLIPALYTFDEDKLHCLPHRNFDREQVGCNLINNFGSELNTIAAGLVMIFIVRAASKAVSKIGGNNSRTPKMKFVLNRLLWVPSKLFSNSLLIIMIDGSQIDVFRLCFLNLFMVNSSVGMLLGALISTLLLSLYAVFGCLIYKAGKTRAKGLWEGDAVLDAKLRRDAYLSKTTTMFSNHGPSGKKSKMQEEAVRSLLDVSEIFQGYRPSQLGCINIHYYFPVMMLTKNMLTQFAIVFFDSPSNLQLAVVLALECIGLIVTVWTRPFANRADKVTSTVSSIALTLIGVTNLIVNVHGVRLSFRDREVYYGWILIALYIVAMSMGILPLIVEALKYLVVRVRRCLAKPKTRGLGHLKTNSKATTSKTSIEISNNHSKFRNKPPPETSGMATSARKLIVASSFRPLNSSTSSSSKSLITNKIKPFSVSQASSSSEQMYRRRTRLLSRSIIQPNKSVGSLKLLPSSSTQL